MWGNKEVSQILCCSFSFEGPGRIFQKWKGKKKKKRDSKSQRMGMHTDMWWPDTNIIAGKNLATFKDHSCILTQTEPG